MKRVCPSTCLLAIALGLWLALIVAGLGGLAAYASRAGTSGAQPEAWPTGTTISRDPTRWTLVLVMHPRCACSRATVEDLNRLLARCDGRLAVRAIFVRPEGADADFEKGDLWNSVTALPDATVQTDVNGVEAQRFGAETSGQAVLYDAQGRLHFRGGLTASRGHAGDNAGCDAIADLVNGKSTDVSRTDVYGCALMGNK